MAMLNLHIRRTTHRAHDLFGECSDDDLVSWGQALVDAEPFFDDEFGSTFPAGHAADAPAGHGTAIPVLATGPVMVMDEHGPMQRCTSPRSAFGRRR